MASMSAQMICSAINQPRKKSRFLQVIAQSHKDEGRSSNNIVDANLHLLRARIGEVTKKEKLERCCRSADEIGWNYAAVEISCDQAKGENEMFQFIRLVNVVACTLVLTILTCTFGLCIMSLVLHLNQ